MDVGREDNNSVTVAPGIQWVMASKNLIFLVMELPMMRVVEGNSGQGREGLGEESSCSGASPTTHIVTTKNFYFT